MSAWLKPKSGYSKVWDLFFPPRCVNCARSGEWVCDSCWKTVKIIKTPTCFRCGRLTDDFKMCKNCRQGININRCLVGCVWGRGALRKILHRLKYNRIRVLTQKLSEVLIDNIQIYADDDLIFAPIPLHYRRYWQRGFNHAEDLAKEIQSSVSGEHINSLLIKIKATKTQVKLSRKQRLKNLTDAFKVNSKYIENIQNKTIVLVDDVVTTGATLNSCAKTLKSAGAKEVWGLVLAKV